MATIMVPADNKVPNAIQEVLLELGVQPQLLGFNYIGYALNLLTVNKGTPFTMTKDLYPEIAKAFGTTSTRVERAIRHSVEKLFDTQDASDISKYIGNVSDLSRGGVTNSQLIAGLALYIQRKAIA